MPKKLTKEKILKRFKEIHKEKYDYTLFLKIEYLKNTQKIPIVCPVHGIFYQSVANHLQGNECPLCAHPSKK